MVEGEGGLRVFAASELNQGLFTNAPRLAGRPLYIGACRVAATRRKLRDLRPRLFTPPRHVIRNSARSVVLGLGGPRSRPRARPSASSRRDLSSGTSADAFFPRHSRKISKTRVLIGSRPAGTTGFLARSLSSAEGPTTSPDLHRRMPPFPLSPPLPLARSTSVI